MIHLNFMIKVSNELKTVVLMFSKIAYLLAVKIHNTKDIENFLHRSLSSIYVSYKLMQTLTLTFMAVNMLIILP